MKTCSRCKQRKPLSEFYNRSGNRSKELNPHCKTCDNVRTKEYRAKTATTERSRYYNLKSKFGLTREEQDALPNRCAICTSTVNLCIDHDHETGIVRGVLCTHCNFGLGQFSDDMNLLFKAAAYLENHRQRVEEGFLEEGG